MSKLEKTKTVSPFAGLGWMALIITVVLAAPVVFFTINLLLGNDAMFAINGYK